MARMNSARTTAPGTRPPGSKDEADAARRIRDMFSGIAPRYDLLNHILSMRMDYRWRRRVAQRFHSILARPDARVLDLCCGTGDLAFALASAGEAQVIGSDFAHPMLQLGRRKSQRAARPVHFVEADSLALPVPDNSLDLVTVGFGFRNYANYERGLREMARVLRRGGEAGILEFCEPRGKVFGPAYRFYFRKVVPRIGGAISGDAAAYSYLPASVENFPEPEELVAMMSAAGFTDVRFETWTFGALALHRGRRK
jgi:demethylmenaquinone methyltransferase/2-methoxy-6-polyprenyl-1,4-benzoquinol methylase